MNRTKLCRGVFLTGFVLKCTECHSEAGDVEIQHAVYLFLIVFFFFFAEKLERRALMVVLNKENKHILIKAQCNFSNGFLSQTVSRNGLMGYICAAVTAGSTNMAPILFVFISTSICGLMRLCDTIH